MEEESLKNQLMIFLVWNLSMITSFHIKNIINHPENPKGIRLRRSNNCAFNTDPNHNQKPKENLHPKEKELYLFQIKMFLS